MTKKKPREERLEEITEAAMHEFLKKGFDGASMDSIAQRAKLTKGGLYHHFGGKDELLIAVYERLMDPIYELMHSAQNHESPMEGIQSFVRNMLSHWAKNSEAVIFTYLALAKGLEVPELAPTLEEDAKTMLGFIEERFDSAIEAEELQDHDASARALALYGALEGVIPLVVTRGPKEAMKIAESLNQVFVEEIMTWDEDED